ncbi:MAG TPA: hypothetical protein V6C88_14450 [Chroococcidiopsis sp.]
MVFILIIVIALVAWALHLMQQAIQCKEFSLMLAGFLVSAAAAALMSVYFLMGHYVGYMAQMSQRAYVYHQSVEYAEWLNSAEFLDGIESSSTELSQL